MAGVNTIEYEVPLPVNEPRVPPVTVTSDCTKLVAASLNVAVINAVCPAIIDVLSDVRETVGTT